MIRLIAEIYGKIGDGNPIQYDHSEDELTGNFFGSLRYISFNRGLKKILVNAVFPKELGEFFEKIDCENWHENIEFWPHHGEGEIDVRILFDECVIGIEVKFLSGLSSNDENGYEREGSESIENAENTDDQEEENIKSLNQLVRESRMVSDWAKDKKKILLLVGDQEACHPIYLDAMRRVEIKENGVLLGYFTWQKALIELRKLKDLNIYDQVIVQDLIDLLERKGFESFQGFHIECEDIDTEILWDFDKIVYKNKIFDSFQGFDIEWPQVDSTMVWKF